MAKKSFHLGDQVRVLREGKSYTGMVGVISGKGHRVHEGRPLSGQGYDVRLDFPPDTLTLRFGIDEIEKV